VSLQINDELQQQLIHKKYQLAGDVKELLAFLGALAALYLPCKFIHSFIHGLEFSFRISTKPYQTIPNHAAHDSVHNAAHDSAHNTANDSEHNDAHDSEHNATELSQLPHRKWDYLDKYAENADNPNNLEIRTYRPFLQ